MEKVPVGYIVQPILCGGNSHHLCLCDKTKFFMKLCCKEGKSIADLPFTFIYP